MIVQTQCHCLGAAPERFNTTKGLELHLVFSGQQEPVLLLNVSIPQAPKLHLDVLLLDVSTVLNTKGVWAAHGPYKTTWACAPPGLVYTQRPLLHLDVSGQQEPLVVSLWRYTKFCKWKQIIEFLIISSKYATFLLCGNLKGLSHEVDFKNFDKKLHNLA